VLQVVASCDLNPVSNGHLASPAAYARLKILAAKAAYVIIADCLSSIHKAQGVFTFMCVSLILWWNLQSVSGRMALGWVVLTPRRHGVKAAEHVHHNKATGPSPRSLLQMPFYRFNIGHIWNGLWTGGAGRASAGRWRPAACTLLRLLGHMRCDHMTPSSAPASRCRHMVHVDRAISFGLPPGQ
jgi:hypothetical protein